jgi:hypothetical protein
VRADGARHKIHAAMTDLIVSYDGTPNDTDALALGKLLAAAGATLSLAYVRHAREFNPKREDLAQHDSEQLLAQGAAWLGDPTIPQHVVISASTGDGLARLAAEQGAAGIVFGSDYRTPPGRAEPGTSAQSLLDGGGIAVAVAAAGLRTHGGGITTIAAAEDDHTTNVTVTALAEKLGARVVDSDEPSDLIVVGSQSEAPSGRITLGGSTRSMLNMLRGSVLVVAKDRPLLF